MEQVRLVGGHEAGYVWVVVLRGPNVRVGN